MNFDLEKAIDGISRITLRGGVVAKLTFFLICFCFSMVAIVYFAKDQVINYFAVIMMFLLSSVTVWRLINFADRNPQAALLEGAEFIVHEQIVHASKSNPGLLDTDTTPVQPDLMEIENENQDSASEPDEKEVEENK